MEDYGLTPRPPQWALDAGLPQPLEDESFCEYVARMGLDCQELLVGLSYCTMPLANYRLATRLQRDMPVEFDRYVAELVREHVSSDRQQELITVARRIWGDRFRRPMGVA